MKWSLTPHPGPLPVGRGEGEMVSVYRRNRALANVGHSQNLQPQNLFQFSDTLSDLDRQDEHGAAVLIEAALQFKDRVVVQPARDQAFILEHELFGQEFRLA